MSEIFTFDAQGSLTLNQSAAAASLMEDTFVYKTCSFGAMRTDKFCAKLERLGMFITEHGYIAHQKVPVVLRPFALQVITPEISATITREINQTLVFVPSVLHAVISISVAGHVDTDLDELLDFYDVDV